MKESEQKQQNLAQLRLELKASIYSEGVLRAHLMKTRPADLDSRLARSLSYQHFLESLISEVFD